MPGTFTAHNIKLPDGTFTIPELEWTISESPWYFSAKRLLSLVYRQGASGKRIADLGCLEGGYTAEFARLGFQAVGIEVRDSNFQNCEYVRQKLQLPNLSFVKDDVWNVEKVGKVDTIFCCGLLYHLDRPASFIELMGRCARDMIIINTHYAADDAVEKFALGPLTEHDGMPGRWYFEHDTQDVAVLESLKWNAWSNQNSFWLSKSAILESLRRSGFDLVFEQYDWLGTDIIQSAQAGYYKTDSRGQFVGIRSSSL